MAWVIILIVLLPAAVWLALLPNRLNNQQIVIQRLLEAPRAPYELARFLTLGRGQADVYRWFKKWEKRGWLVPTELLPPDWTFRQLSETGRRVLPGQRRRFYIGLCLGLLAFAASAGWLLAAAQPAL